MSKLFSRKAGGFYLILAAAVVEMIGLIRFCTWAPQHKTWNVTIAAALAAGLILTAVLMFLDYDLLIVVLTSCYGYALVRLLTDSVGSFVDKYQNIVMFGDATQVPAILTTAGFMGAGVLLTIIAAFMKREKERW